MNIYVAGENVIMFWIPCPLPSCYHKELLPQRGSLVNRPKVSPALLNLFFCFFAYGIGRKWGWKRQKSKSEAGWGVFHATLKRKLWVQLQNYSSVGIENEVFISLPVVNRARQKRAKSLWISFLVYWLCFLDFDTSPRLDHLGDDFIIVTKDQVILL